MRIHTSLTYEQMHRALQAAIERGKASPDVRFATATVHRSRTHARAYEVKLASTSKLPGEKRRRTNTGTGGADSDVWAATYDEWGWFLAELYEADPAAKAGPYADSYDFHVSTGDRFAEVIAR